MLMAYHLMKNLTFRGLFQSAKRLYPARADVTFATRIVTKTAQLSRWLWSFNFASEQDMGH